MKKKTIVLCFDIDGVICDTKSLDYSKSKPIYKNIIKINELFDKGFLIKLFTARYVGRAKNNLKIVKKRNDKITVPQLKKWGVKYHELIYGKPVFSIFVDDRNLFHKKNWSTLIDKEIKKILKNF